MKTKVMNLFIFVALILIVQSSSPIEIVGPGGEKEPPGYVTAEPEAERYDVDDDFAGATWLAAADVNGDGYQDIVGSAWNNAEVAWWKNDGTGEEWTKYTITTGFVGAISVTAADVDGNGFIDVVAAAKMAGDVAWWRNDSGDGTSWARYDVATDVPGLFSLTTVDLDLDGYVDILAQSTDELSKSVIWWANADGLGKSWTEHVIKSGLPGVRFSRIADLDGDDDKDVIAVAFRQNTRKVLWYENDGSANVWTEHTVVDSPEYGCFNVAAADIDGDGDLDIIATNNRIGNYVIWFENDGTGQNWQVHTVDTEFEAPYVVDSADLDSDGDTDVVGTSNSWDTIAWWENIDGEGKTWDRHIIDVTVEKARNPVTNDFNGDGAPDVTAAGFGGSVAWWRLE